MKTVTVRTPSNDFKAIRIPETYADLTGSPPSSGAAYVFVFANSRDDGGATRFMTMCASVTSSAGLPRASTDWQIPVPIAGRVVSLQLKCSSLVPLDNTPASVDTWTVRLNKVDTLMKVQVFPQAGLDESTFAYKIDNVNTFPVVVGDCLSIKWVHNMAGASSNLDFPTCVITIQP